MVALEGHVVFTDADKTVVFKHNNEGYHHQDQQGKKTELK